MVEQGLSFTVIEGAHPIVRDPSFDPRRDFVVAHRVWLGAVPGTDWLHEAVEAELGEDQLQFRVDTRRDSIHVGAAGETAAVVLIFLGALGSGSYIKAFGGALGQAHAEALLEWVRQRAQKRRSDTGYTEADPPPDFDASEPDHLAVGMLGELADVTGIPRDRLELVSAERTEDVALLAVYRDTETAQEYEVAASKDSASFKRREAEAE